jgi:hypothetical protein
MGRLLPQIVDRRNSEQQVETYHPSANETRSDNPDGDKPKPTLRIKDPAYMLFDLVSQFDARRDIFERGRCADRSGEGGHGPSSLITTPPKE